MPGGERMELRDDRIHIEAAVFHECGGEGRGGNFEPDGVQIIERERFRRVTGVVQMNDVLATAADEGFEAERGLSGAFQGLEEQAGDVGLARVRVGAGDEVMRVCHESGLPLNHAMRGCKCAGLLVREAKCVYSGLHAHL